MDGILHLKRFFCKDVRKYLFRHCDKIDHALALSSSRDYPYTIWTNLPIDYAIKGSVRLLEWALKQHPRDSQNNYWSSRICAAAALHGHLHVLKWLRGLNPPVHWNEDTCSSAALGGHLEVLQWARSEKHGRNKCAWNSWTCGGAAKGGHLEVLKWAYANGATMDQWTCVGAAKGGHLEVFQWAKDNGCYVNKKMCIQAAREGKGAPIPL
jgi:hypothetical protein